MSDELKPCPFCGEELTPQRGTAFPWRDHKSGTACYMNGNPVFVHEAEAWNTRADIPWLPPELVEQIAHAATPRTMNPSTAVMAHMDLLRDILAALEPRK